MNQSLNPKADLAVLKSMLEDIAADAGVSVTIAIETFRSEESGDAGVPSSTQHLVVKFEPRPTPWLFQGGYSLGFHKDPQDAQGSTSLSAERAYEACAVAKHFISFLSGGKRVSTAPLADRGITAGATMYYGFNAFYW